MTTKFIHAPMRVGKTQRLIKDYDSTEAKCKLIVRPQLDTRSPDNKVKSRNGQERDAVTFKCLSSLQQAMQPVLTASLGKHKPSVFVDEAQFLSKSAVHWLFGASKALGFDVTFYGLLTDSQAHLFKASSVLIAACDEQEELTAPCELCGDEHGRMTLINDPRATLGLGRYFIGDDEYTRVCPSCFFNNA